MKLLSLTIVLGMLCSNSYVPGATFSPGSSAETVLRKVSEKLNALKQVSYQYKLVIDYTGEGYHAEEGGRTYLDFDPADTRIGFRFQYSGTGIQLIYNRSELFTLNNKTETMNINTRPESQLRSTTFFYNSPIAFRKALPLILADSSISRSLSDTMIYNTSYNLVRLIMKKKSIGHLGEISSPQIDITRIYSLIIDKNTYLPVEIVERFAYKGVNTVRATFSDINLNPPAPAEKSWYYPSYQDRYVLEQPGQKINLIAPGQTAPGWTLARYGSKDSVSLSHYRGKLLLLDFWFCYCGPCIESVPGLNKLEEKYEGKNFKLLSVNTHDTPEQIGLFIKNNHPSADILLQGEELSKQYGIQGFPTLVLIDQSGKVIYSGGYDYDRIDGLISRHL